MARQNLTKLNGSPAGTPITYATPTVDGFMWYPEDHDLLVVKNGNAAACVVTFQIPRTVGGVALTHRTESIPAGTEQAFALERGLYNRPIGSADEGKVYVDFSVQTSVTVALFAATNP